MNVIGEISSKSVDGTKIQHKRGCLIKEGNAIYIINDNLYKLDVDNFVDKLCNLNWKEELNFILLGVFCEGTVLISFDPEGYLYLSFLKFDKRVTLLLPSNDKKIDDCFVKVLSKRFSIILVINKHLIYQWIPNENIYELTESNINSVEIGEWCFINSFSMDINRIYLLGTAISVFDNGEIVFDPMCIVSFVFYDNSEKSLFCESCLFSVQNCSKETLKKFTCKLLSLSMPVENNNNENIWSSLIRLSFSFNLPLLAIVFNGHILNNKQYIIYLNVLCNSISTFHLDFGSSTIQDIIWDSQGNFLFGIISNGLVFCCTRLGNPIKINLYKNNKVLSNEKSVALFSHYKENLTNEMRIVAYSENNSLICSYGNEIISLTIKFNNPNHDESFAESIINDLIILTTNSFITASSQSSEMEISRYVKEVKLKENQNADLFESCSDLKSFQSNFQSLMGYVLSANFKDKEYDIHFINLVIELLINYMEWQMRCFSQTSGEINSKAQVLNLLFKNMCCDLLKFDSLWSFSSEAMYYIEIKFLERYSNHSLQIKYNEEEITIFLLYSEIIKLFVESYLYTYTYIQSDNLNILPFTIVCSYEKNSMCIDSYYVTKFLLSLENLYVIGKGLVEAFSDQELRLFKKWKKWYNNLELSFLNDNVIYPDNLLNNESQIQLMFVIIDQIKNMFKQGVKIHSLKLSKKLHSLMYLLIVLGKLSECLELIDVISTLKTFRKSDTSNIMDFLECFPINLNESSRSHCMKSPAVQSMGRIMAAYFSGKPIFISHPKRPHFIKSSDMENQRDLKVSISRNMLETCLSQNVDLQFKFTVNRCFEYLTASGLYYESAELAYSLNDWKTCIVLLEIHQINVHSPYLSCYSNNISTKRVLNDHINDIFEIFNNKSDPTFSLNKLWDVIKVRKLLSSDVLSNVLDIVLNNYMIPIAKSMPLCVTDDMYLPTAPLYSTPNITVSMRNEMSDLIKKEMKCRFQLHNLLNLFWLILEKSNMLSHCVSSLIRKILFNLKTEKDASSSSLTKKLTQYLNDKEYFDDEESEIQELFDKFIYLIYFLYLRDNANLHLRSREKSFNFKYEEYLDYSKEVCLSLKPMLFFNDFHDDCIFLRSNILFSLLELKPDISVVQFLVKWNFTKEYCQQFDLKTNNLLTKLINKLRFYNTSENNDLLFGECQINLDTLHSNKNLAFIYNEMLICNTERNVTNETIELVADNRCIISFMKYLELFLSVKYSKSKPEEYCLNKKGNFSENSKKHKSNDYKISNLIKWASQRDERDSTIKITLNADSILLILTHV